MSLDMDVKQIAEPIIIVAYYIKISTAYVAEEDYSTTTFFSYDNNKIGNG